MVILFMSSPTDLMVALFFYSIIGLVCYRLFKFFVGAVASKAAELNAKKESKPES
jgi:hypothetical protein